MAGNKDYTAHLFIYQHDGANWGFEIQARDAQDAKDRLAKLAYARYEGEVVASLPARAGPTVRLLVAARNLFHKSRIFLLLMLLGVAAGVAWGKERELRMVRPPAQMSMPCAYWTEIVLWLAEMPESQRAGAVFGLRQQSEYLYAFAVDAAKYLSHAEGELKGAAMLECGEWKEL